MQGITLYDTLPPSLKNNKEIKAICNSLQPELDKQWTDVDSIAIYKNLDSLPGDIIDSLAYSFHVDFYRQEWPIEKRRAVVKNAIKYHRYKGTAWAVEDFISTIFSKSWVKEWFEYNGNPYFFKVYTENNLNSEEQLNFFYDALYTVKNSRSWLECFILLRNFLNKLYVGGAYSVFRIYRFGPHRFDGMKGFLNQYQGAYLRTLKKESYGLNMITDFAERYRAYWGAHTRELHKHRYVLNPEDYKRYREWR